MHNGNYISSSFKLGVIGGKIMKVINVIYLLLIIILIGLLSACQSDDTGKELSSETSIQNEIENTENLVVYTYPEYDFGGEEFKFLVLRTGYWGQDINDLWTSELIGDALNDSVIERNSIVENKYNVKISVTETSDGIGDAKRFINAGEDVFHVLQEKVIYTMSSLAAENYLYDFYKIPNLNLDASWFDKNNIVEMSILNKLFILGGDIEISDKMATIVLLFNKKLLEDYQLENPYELVNENKWTLDKLYDIMVLASADLDGDGIRDKNDRWGLLFENFGGWVFLEGSGNKLALKDKQDIPYLNVYNEKVESALSKIKKIMYDPDNRAGSGYDAEDYENMFMADQALFVGAAMSSIPPYRDMESDFGIIPCPKYDEKQTDYYTAVSPWVARMLSVPITNKAENLEMIGAVIDSMARESTATLKVAYYDKLLNGKIARDSESSEMLDIIFNNIAHDIGVVFNWGNSWFKYEEFFRDKKDNFASFYETYSNIAETEMQNTIIMFGEN